MKKAFIVYFEDKSAVVVLAEDMQSVCTFVSLEQLEKVSRIDLVPYPVL